MASLFRAPRRPPATAEEEKGSGEKILRGRRRVEPPPESPYARSPQRPPPGTPPPLLLPSSSPSTGSPRSLLGLIFGAGKLISSVFHSDSSSSSSSSASSSYGYYSDEDLDRRSDKEEDINQTKELYELNQVTQGEKNLKLHNCMEGSQAIVPLSESKLAIEQLLMQETFSRDECTRLIKIIQSRVVGSSSSGVQDRAESEVLKICVGSARSPPGARPSLNQKREQTKSLPSSPSNLGTLLPRSPTPLAYAPGLHSIAVLEAKKWIDDKKLMSNSNSDTVCGPCSFNTDMLHYEFQDEGSPADLAKSYMQSLPPWKSPTVVSNRVTTPPSSKLHLHKDESTPLTANSSFPSFKVFKRKYLSSRLTESPEDARRVRMRSSDYLLGSPELRGIYSSVRSYENGILKVSSLADEGDREAVGTNHDFNTLKALGTPTSSAKLTAEFQVRDHYSSKTFKLSDKVASEVNTSTVSDRITSTSIPSQPEEAVRSVELADESEPPIVALLEHSHAKLEKEPVSSPRTSNEINAVEPLQTEDQHAFIDRDSSSKGKIVLSEGINLAIESAADGATKSLVEASNVHVTRKVAGTMEVNNSAELILQSGTSPHTGDPQLKDEVNESINKFPTKGPSAELKADSDLESSGKGNPANTYSSNVELTMGFSGGKHEHLSEAANEVTAVHGAETAQGTSQNGTNMRLIESVLTEPLPSTSRGRRKTVVKLIRGRGRGRGQGQGRGRRGKMTNN